MKHTLLSHLYNGIFEANKQYDVLLVVFIIIIHAVICSIVISFDFKIMKYLGENNKPEVIRWSIYSALLNCVRDSVYYLYSMLYQKRLQLYLKLFFTEKYLRKMYLKSNRKWLHCNKSSEINTAINSGVGALMQTLRFLIDVFNPLLQAIGSVLIISTYTGIEIIIVFIILILTFVSGIKLLELEYNTKQQINKKTNPLNAYNTWLANTILPSILNNLGEKTIQSILSNSTKNQELNQPIRLKTMKGYTVLEIFGNIAIMSVVYYMSPNLEVSILVAINTNLYSTYNKMWWLFRMFDNAASNAAEWSSLQQYLQSVVPEPDHYKVPLHKYQFSNQLKLQNTEYQLCGKSGTGKSTFILNEVMNLSRHYFDGWLYLDQNMSVPKSSCITIRQFLCNFINDDVHLSQYTEQTIIHWGSFLELSNIVNLTTLDNAFTSPSGGEVKRLNILQMLLPIFMDQIKIKVLLLDEITSGLDDDTYNIIRRLIDYLKSYYHITVVNIDHHAYEVGQTKVNLIKVRDGTCPWDNGDNNYDDDDDNDDNDDYNKESCFTKYCKSIGFSYKYIKNGDSYDNKNNDNKLSFPPEIMIDLSI